MAENTAIEWTTHTWNPWQGCHKVSSGCDNCYMYRDKKRYGQDPTAVIKSSHKTFNLPLRIKEPSKVFVCSWSDFFIEDADEWRVFAWMMIKRTPHLTYQILTKRPGNIKDRLPADWGSGYPNVWLGVTAENQELADKRIPALLQIPAAVRFVSVEPMLGPVDLREWIGCNCPGDYFDNGGHNIYCPMGKETIRSKPDWIICGGESGPGARPMHPDWARSLRDQCVAAKTRFFFKQWGEYCAPSQMPPETYRAWDIHHGTENCWAEDEPRHWRVGKKAAGRLLDGREWDEYPEASRD